MWGLRSRTEEDSEKRPRTRLEEVGEDGSPTEEEVRRPGRWSSTVTASEMRPRKEAISPVDTVRRRGRSKEAVIAEGDVLKPAYGN
ncbi:hypothetical protein BHE74_00027551 [Ensete ventricosum]|nr:hypothetical protein BHE74_00027551 [Ensete ventricosum]